MAYFDYAQREDYNNQLTPHHLVKTGLGFRQFDFDYRHFMGVYEGGNRWNLVNVFSGRPYEGSLFVQDKIEYPGLVVNAGVRVELSMDVRNVFNQKFLRRLYGDNLIRRRENPNLSECERLPPNWFSNEYDEWEWYSYEVAPRQINFQFKAES